jgi:type I restriction enzyme, S subunit
MREGGKLEGWKVEKLGDVIQLEYGKPLDASKRSEDGKYPVYGANGEIARSNEYYYDKPTMIVGRKGSAGEINLTEKKFWALDVTYFVTFDDKKYDLQFLYYLLSKLELTKLAKGVKPGINRNDVYSIEVAIPPLPEQQRIVSVLDEAFASIAQAKSNAERNLVNARELFGSYLHEIFETPGKNWETCPLDKYVKFIDYRGHTPTKTQSGMRLITAKNVKLGYLQRTPEEFVDPKIYDKWMVRGFPKKGDVLFTTEAPLANVAQLDSDEKILFAQRIIILQPQQEKIDQTFLKYLLLSQPIRKSIFSKGTGATVQGIKARLLKTVEIYFPPLAEQRAIVGRLEALSAETGRLEEIYWQKVESLEELKRSVLGRAFEGNL